MLDSTKNFISRFTYKPIRKKIAKKIRINAIENTKARLAIHHQKLDDYNDEELEIIVADEERKIVDSLKTKSIFVILSLLGINIFV